MNRSRNFGLRLGLTAFTVALIGFATPARGQTLQELKSHTGGTRTETTPENRSGPDTYAGPGHNNLQPGQHDNGRGGNTFVNDPCLDPPPGLGVESNRRTVQSETELAVLNTPGSMGKKIVAGYNDSYGFYNNREGLSGYAYSTNGGNTWIDGGGLPPKSDDDLYAGDPVVVVDNSPRTFTVNGQAVSQPAGVFYYSSIYLNDQGVQTLSVNRGQFVNALPSSVESISSTRCLNHPEQFGIPDPPKQSQERVKWEPPVEAVITGNLCRQIPNPNPGPGEPPTITVCDDLDKEWLYVSPRTGELYVTYTRFGFDNSTPLEMVRSKDGGRTWEGPFVIVPNLDDTFNQATQIVEVLRPAGRRLIVVWHSRTFSLITGAEISQRIERAFSDNDGTTWTSPGTVAQVNPQGEPLGYNRGRASILNAPYLIEGGGKIFVAYFNGKTALPTASISREADVYVSRSLDNGVTWTGVKINDDDGLTSHVFPTVQVDKQGQVFAGWLDRRNDPANNLLTDAWANVSHDGGVTFGHDKLQTDVATTWFVRRDAAPNFGDYNSSELLGFNQFVMTWADGRFLAQDPADPAKISFERQATPDMIFTIANGLGVGEK
jgi:hypothetical protein